MSDIPQNSEQIKREAEAAGERSGDLRATVRDMTLRALKSRELSLSEVREVVRAVSEGVSMGLGKRGGELKGAAPEAFAGLDQAVRKSAEATKLAAQQLLSQGKDLTAQDIKPVLEDLKRLESEMLDTLGQAADRAGSRVKEAFTELLSHARRTGTDTGRQVADTISEFSGRAAPALKAGAADSVAAARELSKRIAVAASGILSGMADALHERATGTQKTDQPKAD